MARPFLPPRLYRLGLFIWKFLLRHPIRSGCRAMWAALWRLLRKSFAVHRRGLSHLRHCLSSFPPTLRCKEAGNNCQGGTQPDADVHSPSLPFRETEAVVGAVLPYISQDCPSADLGSSGTSRQVLSTMSDTHRGDIVTVAIPSATYPHIDGMNSPSSASFANDEHYMLEEKNTLVTTRSSQASTSSETLNNIPLQTIQAVEGDGSLYSVARPATLAVHAPDIVPHRVSMGSYGSEWEISGYIWPMIPPQVPRYTNNRIV